MKRFFVFVLLILALNFGSLVHASSSERCILPSRLQCNDFRLEMANTTIDFRIQMTNIHPVPLIINNVELYGKVLDCNTPMIIASEKQSILNCTVDYVPNSQQPRLKMKLDMEINGSISVQNMALYGNFNEIDEAAKMNIQRKIEEKDRKEKILFLTYSLVFVILILGGASMMKFKKLSKVKYSISALMMWSIPILISILLALGVFKWINSGIVIWIGILLVYVAIPLTSLVFSVLALVKKEPLALSITAVILTGLTALVFIGVNVLFMAGMLYSQTGYW